MTANHYPHSKRSREVYAFSSITTNVFHFKQSYSDVDKADTKKQGEKKRTDKEKEGKKHVTEIKSITITIINVN